MKLKPGDLKVIAERMRATTSLRKGEWKTRITVHTGSCGVASGARDIMKAFLKQAAEQDVNDVIFTTSDCAGLCDHEPMATVELGDEPPIKYVKLTEAKVRRIFQDHVVGGRIVTEYALVKGNERVE